MTTLVYLTATGQRATRSMLGLSNIDILPAGVLPLHLEQPSHDPLTHEVADTGETEVRGHAAFAVYTVDERPLSSVQADLLTIVAEKRREVETVGITFSGVRIRTDFESQAKLTGAWARVQQDPGRLIDWKGENGWVRCDKATIEAIAAAAGIHVQECFSRECALVKQIEEARSLSELPTIGDIVSGWPG